MVVTMCRFIYILDSSKSSSSSVLAQEATELVFEPVTQMAVELINNLILAQEKI